MSGPAENEEADPEWSTERDWLIALLRRGLPMTTEAEKARVMSALNRLLAEIGDPPDRMAIHEAGHAVVAHALDWFVEYIEPRMPDGGAGAMIHQKRLEFSPLKNEWERFLEQATVGVAGYVAEEIAFGLAAPYEAIDLRDRAWAEHGVGEDQFGELIEHAEAQARAILERRWQTVGALAEAQVTGARVEGNPLRAILTPPRRWRHIVSNADSESCPQSVANLAQGRVRK